MKLEGPVLAVRDLQASLVFYQTVLGLEIIRGFGDSVELEGGLSLQTLDSWAGSPVSYTHLTLPTTERV